MARGLFFNEISLVEKQWSPTPLTWVRFLHLVHMDINKALENIKLFQALVPNSFTVYGTCLGLIRDNGIINHDKDTDMGISIHNFDWSIIQTLGRAGFRVGRIFGMPSCGMEIAFHKDGVKTDLMVFYKHEDKIWNSLWNNGGENGLSDMIIHSYPSDIFKKRSLIQGISVLSEDYLVHVYGEDWRTPTSPWNWRTDHKCIDNEFKKIILKKYA